MKFSININQEMAVEIAPELDLIDFAILDYIKGLLLWTPDKMKTIVVDGERYFWLSYTHLLREMPLLKLKQKASISNRLKGLESAKMIVTQSLKGNVYVAIGEKAYYLDFSDVSHGGTCAWCGQQNVPVLKHHFPVAASQGGQETVRICPNCHYKFHYGGHSHEELVKTNGLLAKINEPVSQDEQHKQYINKPIKATLTAGFQPAVLERKKPGDPRVKELITYFSQMCLQVKSFKPVINWGAEGAMIKRYLEEYSSEELKQALLWFLESNESERLGCTIKVALSNYVFNKWLSQRNL